MGFTSQLRLFILLILKNDRDTQGLVLCVAKTEQSEPGVARAEGIAHKIIQHKTRPKGTRPNKNKSNLKCIAQIIFQQNKKMR
ncbi:MAG: hypothetical protein EBR08_02605 [Bacteroidia bacterium]|nr:hypothetical protein [Bacteroidia bacterium]